MQVFSLYPGDIYNPNTICKFNKKPTIQVFALEYVQNNGIMFLFSSDLPLIIKNKICIVT